MAVNQRTAARLIKGLHTANTEYFVKTFHLSREEAEFLLNTWKAYVKEHPDVMKRSALLSLDCFIHGYLSHANFCKINKSLSGVSSLASLGFQDSLKVKERSGI